MPCEPSDDSTITVFRETDKQMWKTYVTVEPRVRVRARARVRVRVRVSDYLAAFMTLALCSFGIRYFPSLCISFPNLEEVYTAFQNVGCY